ncbi:hypothetical protein DFH09DRAFT_447337 [Mycena vulgaris]|nr:hypothetical protein DFH09DRAFT_447337 [Mycena vulgaris]
MSIVEQSLTRRELYIVFEAVATPTRGRVADSKSGSRDGKSGPEPEVAGTRLSESGPVDRSPRQPAPPRSRRFIHPHSYLPHLLSRLLCSFHPMAPRIVPPPKKNRARCGLKYSLKIVKGDLGPEADYVDEEGDESQSLLADVDVNETMEHHLQAALATNASDIPTPGDTSQVPNKYYEQLYPSDRWRDPISYLQTTQTVEEACANALVDDECTYYMDEVDKQWLDKNNQEARGEGTSAQGARPARKGKDKEPEMGVPVSITEDEFELVMGLLEKITDQKVLEGDGPDFSLYRHFFLEPLPANIFASYTAPSWIPPPALLVRIARTIYPHWKHRRSLLKGRRIRPSLNYDEFDFLNESYICFRRRENKPVRKTRAGQVVNNADKLMQIHKNLSQALELANALLTRETVKQTVAVESQNVWNARLPLVDLLRAFPAMATKVDEALLVEKPKKIKSIKSSLPKVKVLPPSNPSAPVPAPVGKVTLPSERCTAIRLQVADIMAEDSKRNQHQADVVDDPYQSPYIPRAEKMWVDVPSLAPPTEEQLMRSGTAALRVRYGRGGRRFVDRRRSHPYLSPLRNHRRHLCDEPDEEDTRRLEAQWTFDGDDCPVFGPVEEQHRELLDEYDSKYLIARMGLVSQTEAELVTDAALMVPGPDGRERRMLPFLANAIHVAWARSTPLADYLSASETSVSTSSTPRHSSAAATPRAGVAGTPVHQKTAQASSASPHPRAQAPAVIMRPPSVPGPQPRMQENISPPASSPVSSAAPIGTRQPLPRTYATPVNPALPHNPNPIVPAQEADAAKVVVAQPNVNVNHPRGQNPNHVQGQTHPPAHPLQTNGARTAVPAYVPLSAGTNMSLKLPPRMPRPSPLAMHSPVVAAQNASVSPRTNGS